MTRRASQKVTFTGTNAAEVEITGLAANNTYALESIVLKRTNGSAANWTPLLGNKTAFTDDPTDGRIAAFSASALTTIDHQFDPPVLVRTDANGKLYIKPQWDAGADNDCTGHVMVRRGG